MRGRLLVAFAVGCVASVLVYALLRAGQVLFGREANPATIIVRSPHLAYFWRAWTSAFAGALAGASAHLCGERHSVLLARALVPALGITLAVLVAQALLLP